MTTPQVSEEIVETALTTFWSHDDSGSISAMRVALEAVAPALMAEKDAEIERQARVIYTLNGMAIDEQAQTRAARAEGAGEVRAAVEALAVLGVHGSFNGAEPVRIPLVNVDELRAAISPEGVAAHNAKIAAEVSQEIAEEIETTYENWRTLDPANPLTPNPPLHSNQWYVQRAYADAARIARTATVREKP